MFYDDDWYDRCYYDFFDSDYCDCNGTFKTKAKIHLDTVKEEVRLEELKNQNFLLETEKMKLELEKLSLEDRNKIGL